MENYHVSIWSLPNSISLQQNLFYHMIRPYIKPFHKFSNKTRYITLFTPVSRFFASDFIRRSIITSRKARRLRAIFAWNFLKIHTVFMKYWYFSELSRDKKNLRWIFISYGIYEMKIHFRSYTYGSSIVVISSDSNSSMELKRSVSSPTFLRNLNIHSPKQNCSFSPTHQWKIEQAYDILPRILYPYYISHDSFITNHSTSIILIVFYGFQDHQYHLVQ